MFFLFVLYKIEFCLSSNIGIGYPDVYNDYDNYDSEDDFQSNGYIVFLRGLPFCVILTSIYKTVKIEYDL